MVVSKKITKEQTKKAPPKKAATPIKKAAIKPVKTLYLSDDAIDIEAFDKLVNADVPNQKRSLH